MPLILNEEQKLLQSSAAQYFSESMSVESFRAKRDRYGVAKPSQDEWQQMVELGWSSVLVPESLGGLEFGLTGIAVICIEAAKHLAPTHLVQTGVLAAWALNNCEPSAQRDELLRCIAAGKLCFSVLEPGSSFADSFVNEGNTVDQLLVLDEHLRVMDLAETQRTPVNLIDRRDYAKFDRSNSKIAGELTLREGARESLNAVGATITACELFAVSLVAFEQTLVYLREREQFGQKIGAFQALQHRMASAYMKIEMLRSVLLDALSALDTQRDDAPLAASHAKALANQTAQLVTTEAIQLHGGMGITDELDIGLFYKRARVLQSAWGSTAHHKQQFATLSGY